MSLCFGKNWGKFSKLVRQTPLTKGIFEDPGTITLSEFELEHCGDILLFFRHSGPYSHTKHSFRLKLCLTKHVSNLNASVPFKQHV